VDRFHLNFFELILVSCAQYIEKPVEFTFTRGWHSLKSHIYWCCYFVYCAWNSITFFIISSTCFRRIHFICRKIAKRIWLKKFCIECVQWLRIPNINLRLSTYNIAEKSIMAIVLQNCKIIIWDHFKKMHKRTMEALDWTLKDLRSNKDLFRATMILVAGDFHQTLPVILKSIAADEIIACMKSSNLWRYEKILKWPTNMWVTLKNDESAEVYSNLFIECFKILVVVSNGLISCSPNFFNSQIERKNDHESVPVYW